MSRTPIRSVRVPEELWQAAQAVAARQDRTLTDVINDALRRYVKRSERP